MDDRESLFLNKLCKIELKRNNFVLTGYVREIDNFGILFQTTQKTAYIGWDQILELVPLKEQQP